MEEIAASEGINFILNTGDNFYSPNGVKSVNDKSWDTHWANIYQVKPHLGNLTWYGVLGNHDYGGSDVEAEI